MKLVLLYFGHIIQITKSASFSEVMVGSYLLLFCWWSNFCLVWSGVLCSKLCEPKIKIKVFKIGPEWLWCTDI